MLCGMPSCDLGNQNEYDSIRDYSNWDRRWADPDLKKISKWLAGAVLLYNNVTHLSRWRCVQVCPDRLPVQEYNNFFVLEVDLWLITMVKLTRSVSKQSLK